NPDKSTVKKFYTIMKRLSHWIICSIKYGAMLLLVPMIACDEQVKTGTEEIPKAEVSSVELPVIQAALTDAPNVPPPITRKHRAKVVVRLEVKEVVKRLADGVDYTFWTYGGSVPGKFIRVRENDEIEFHLINLPDSK